MYAHYHRETDIAWFLLADDPSEAELVSEEADWGLIDRDSQSGDVVGVELWHASKRLPAELLDALPEPEGKEVVIERQPA